MAKKRESGDEAGSALNQLGCPANDRKTPYTEEELEEFAEGFILSMRDTAKLKSMIEKDGLAKVKEIIRDSFRKHDGSNLMNMSVTGSIH